MANRNRKIYDVDEDVLKRVVAGGYGRPRRNDGQRRIPFA